jgi:prepilin signal peptidase PulO-like enzyme (type II secretory pathway)
MKKTDHRWFVLVYTLCLLSALTMITSLKVLGSNISLGNQIHHWPIATCLVLLSIGLMYASVTDVVSFTAPTWVFDVLCCAGFILHALWIPPEIHLQSIFFFPQPQGSFAVAIIAATLCACIVSYFKRHEFSVAPLESDSEPVSFSSGMKKITLVAIIFMMANIIAFVSLRGTWKFLLPYIGACMLVLLFVLMLRSIGFTVNMGEETATTMDTLMPILKQDLGGVLLPLGFGIFTYNFINMIPSLRNFCNGLPIQSIAGSMLGFLIGAGVGWIIRIVSSFILRKEAFGESDILLLAAVGACAGWFAAILTLLCASVTGLLIVSGCYKKVKGRYMPFIPALTIAVIIVVAYQVHFARYLGFIR